MLASKRIDMPGLRYMMWWYPDLFLGILSLTALFLARFYSALQLSDTGVCHNRVICLIQIFLLYFTVTLSVSTQSNSVNHNLWEVYNSRKATGRIVVSSYFCLCVFKYTLLNGLHSIISVFHGCIMKDNFWWGKDEYLISFHFLFMSVSLTLYLVIFLKFCCNMIFFLF